MSCDIHVLCAPQWGAGLWIQPLELDKLILLSVCIKCTYAGSFKIHVVLDTLGGSFSVSWIGGSFSVS